MHTIFKCSKIIFKYVNNIMEPIFEVIFCGKCTCRSCEQYTEPTIFQPNANTQDKKRNPNEYQIRKMKRAESHQLKNSVQETNRQKKKKKLMMRACKGEREHRSVIKYNFLLQLFCYHARPLFCKLQYQQELKQQNYILTKEKKKN